MRLHLIFIVLLLSLSLHVAAQTPVANRVNAVVRHLPSSAIVVAKYTDNHRHCLYYIINNRLYRYDVLNGRKEEVAFSTDSYSKVLSCWMSPDGNFFFICVDRRGISHFYLDDGQELWRYDSRTRRIMKIGQGYHVKKNDSCITIKRASRCTNPSAPQSHQKWMARDHYYDLYGKVIFVKDEFPIK